MNPRAGLRAADRTQAVRILHSVARCAAQPRSDIKALTSFSCFVYVTVLEPSNDRPRRVSISTGELNCSLVTPCELHRGESRMDALIEKLDTRLRQWKPETASQVRQFVAEIIDVADQDVLDLMRSRAAEQEVLDLLDEPASR